VSRKRVSKTTSVSCQEKLMRGETRLPKISLESPQNNELTQDQYSRERGWLGFGYLPIESLRGDQGHRAVEISLKHTKRKVQTGNVYRNLKTTHATQLHQYHGVNRTPCQINVFGRVSRAPQKVIFAQCSSTFVVSTTSTLTLGSFLFVFCLRLDLPSI
jgi:hypothetical protein